MDQEREEVGRPVKRHHGTGDQAAAVEEWQEGIDGHQSGGFPLCGEEDNDTSDIL